MRAIATWNERSKRTRKQPIHHIAYRLLLYVVRLGVLLLDVGLRTQSKMYYTVKCEEWWTRPPNSWRQAGKERMTWRNDQLIEYKEWSIVYIPMGCHRGRITNFRNSKVKRLWVTAWWLCWMLVHVMMWKRRCPMSFFVALAGCKFGMNCPPRKRTFYCREGIAKDDYRFTKISLFYSYGK